MRYMMVDGQGNFGSIDGDGHRQPMRYTEARLSNNAEEMLADLDKDTVDFVDNFDGSLQEPEVLPFPHAKPAAEWFFRHRCGYGHQYSPT